MLQSESLYASLAYERASTVELVGKKGALAASMLAKRCEHRQFQHVQLQFLM